MCPHRERSGAPSHEIFPRYPELNPGLLSLGSAWIQKRDFGVNGCVKRDEFLPSHANYGIS